MKNITRALLLALTLVSATQPLRAQSADPLPLPYQNGFEQYDGPSGYTYSAPSDWTVTGSYLLDFGFMTYGPFPAVAAQDAHSGSKTLYFYTVAGSPNFISTPLLDHEANGLLVSFWAALQGDVMLTVGLITDPADSNTFTPLFSTDQSTNEEYEEFSFTTDGLDIEGNVAIAFRTSTSSGDLHYVMIDDLSVSENSDCETPTSLEASATGYSTATLSWEGTSGLGYEVRYNASGNLADPATVVATTTGTTLALEGLEHGTVYYAWVAAQCDGELSPLAAFAPFSTDTACYTLASAEVGTLTATSAALGWTYSESGEAHTGVVITVADQTDPTAEPYEIEATGISTFVTDLVEGHHYTFELRTRCDTLSAEPVVLHAVPLGTPCAESASPNGYYTSTYYPAWTAYEHSASLMLYRADDLVGVGDINTIALRTANAVPSYAHRFTVYMAATANTVVPSGISLDSLSLVATDVEVHAWTSGWMPIPLDSTFTLAAGQNLYVLLLNDNDNYTDGFTTPEVSYANHAAGYAATLYRSSTEPFAVDTVSFSTANRLPDMRFYGECVIPVCDAPSVAIGEVGETSLTVVWLDEQNGNFLPQLRAATDTAWTSLPLTTEHTATFDSLESSTQYQVRIGAICYNGDTVFSPELAAWTLCTAVSAPHAYTFSQGIDHCWTVAPDVTVTGSGNTAYVQLETAYGVQRDWMVTPELADAIASLQLRIRATDYWGRDSVLSIGACNPDGSDVEWIAHLHVPASTSTYTEQVLRLDSYEGDKHHLMVRSGNMRLRSVTIEYLDPCAIQEDLVIDTVTMTSATLSWLDVNQAGLYELQYRPAGSGQEWASAIDSATTATLDSLAAGTSYEVRVRAICSAVDTSVWTPGITFRTECAAIAAIPYSEDFTGNSHECWTVLDLNQTTIDNWSLSANGLDSTACIFSRHSAAYTSDEWFISPVIELPADTLLDLTWWGKNPANGANYSDYTVLVSPTASMLPEYFTNILATVEAEEDWTEHTLPLSYSGAIRIAFHHSGYNGGGVSIDNISITVPELRPCEPPTGLAVSQVSDDVARAEWVPADTADHEWELEVTAEDYEHTYTVTNIPFTFSGLAVGTHYSLRVRTRCGEDYYSDWSEPYNYYIQPSAPEGIDLASPSVVSLHPNPASSVVVVEVSAASQVTLLDVSGREVYRSADAATRHTVDLSHTAPGIYYVRIAGARSFAVQKLIVQ